MCRCDKVNFILYVGDTKVRVAYVALITRIRRQVPLLVQILYKIKYILLHLSSVVKREPSSVLLDALIANSDNSITISIGLRFSRYKIFTKCNNLFASQSFLIYNLLVNHL